MASVHRWKFLLVSCYSTNEPAGLASTKIAAEHGGRGRFAKKTAFTRISEDAT
jgi:hypothetical protein